MDSITIPKGLLKDLYMGLAKVEEDLATLEEIVDPERRLSEGIGRIIVKAEKPYRDLARSVDVDHAIAKSRSLCEFVKALRGYGYD